MHACLNVDRLSSMQQFIVVIAFFTVVLIIFYINIFCPDLNYALNIQLETHKSSFVAWNKTNYRIPYHPSLIIIGSVNGGTSLLNDLYAFFLQSFYDDDKRRDSFYWSRCIPCNEYKHRTIDFNNWNVSQYNLCNPTQDNDFYIYGSQKKEIFDRLHLHKYKDFDNKIECRIEQYKSVIMQDHTTSNWNRFSAERCSGYIYVPYVAKIFANLFPETILLYAIREKATQQYSRAKNFHKGMQYKTRHEELYFNEQFKIYLDEIESDRVQNGLLILLNQSKQTIKIRDDIIWWYLNYPSIKGKKPSPWQIDFRDLCPYVNVLVWKKILSIYNIKYGFSKLKLIQSEWLYSNLLQSARFLHCIVLIQNWNSNKEMNECYEYYQQNMNDIMSKNDQMKLMNNKYGKNEKYEYLLGDLNTFNKLTQFWQLCDKRLFELINQYPSLTVGAQWNYDLWVKQRQNMRNSFI